MIFNSEGIRRDEGNKKKKKASIKTKGLSVIGLPIQDASYFMLTCWVLSSSQTFIFNFFKQAMWEGVSLGSAIFVVVVFTVLVWLCYWTPALSLKLKMGRLTNIEKKATWAGKYHKLIRYSYTHAT